MNSRICSYLQRSCDVFGLLAITFAGDRHIQQGTATLCESPAGKSPREDPVVMSRRFCIGSHGGLRAESANCYLEHQFEEECLDSVWFATHVFAIIFCFNSIPFSIIHSTAPIIIECY
jgi:hypothetical protein